MPAPNTSPAASSPWLAASAPQISPRHVLLATAVLLLWGLDFALDIRQIDFASWLDPVMYLNAAREIRFENWAPRSLVIPTVYPYSLVPLSRSPSTALWANFAWVLVLAASLYSLCGTFKIKAPPALVLLVLLTSPVLLGLSRTLFSEPMLTAAVTLVISLLLGCKALTPGRWLLLGLALSLALVAKPTAILFLAGPAALKLTSLLRDRQTQQFKALVFSLALALIVAVTVQFTLLRSSLQYYVHSAWTNTGAMALIGPGDLSSFAALLYYPTELFRSGLGWVSLVVPLVLAAPLVHRQTSQPSTISCGTFHVFTLLLWLLIPLVILTVVPMKEPRHFLPCVVPAVLLMFCGLSALPDRWRRLGLTVTVLLAIAQYLLATNRLLPAPYFADRPLRFESLAAAILPPSPATASEPATFGSMTQREFDWQHWVYARNFALIGFAPQQASLLSWQFAPAIVYDLDHLPRLDRDSLLAYDCFADLFSYTHFSLYNAALGCPRSYFTLSGEVILQNADFILVLITPSAPVPPHLPDHTLRASVPTPLGLVHLFAATRPTVPYRELYSRAYLDQVRSHGSYDPVELNTVVFEFLMQRMFLHRSIDLQDFTSWFPADYRPSIDRYDIHWVGGRTGESIDAVERSYQELAEQWPAD